jgi:peptidoglycan/LPS O-acetylase OafA/YrhL
MTGRLSALDGLRAIAILSVMGFHLDVHGAIPGGFLGVDLFFVLSGYLITSVLLRNGGLADFYASRALRILPPLVAAIALAAALNPVGKKAIAAGLLFFANAMPPATMGSLGHLWSLAVEEQFYLVWPAIFLLAGRWRVPLLWGAVALSIAVRALLVWHGATEESLAYRLALARGDTIALGCLAALQGWRWSEDRLQAACLVLLGLAFVTVRGYTPWLVTLGFTAFGLLCAALLSSLVGTPDSAVKRLLSHPALGYVGRRSYGLYLYHIPIFWALDVWNRHLFWPIAFGLTFLVAEISYRTIERAADRVKLKYRAASAAAEPRFEIPPAR